MNEITISNVGPIADLAIELSPGVNVLRGHNGSGKSTAINGVSRLLGGTANGLSAKDGEKRGEITLGDATLSITKSRSAVRGEIEVTGIEGRLDIGELVDPGIADAEKADAKRIKALISLSGVRANSAIFFDAVGGADEYAALGVDESTTDILLLGARVKRSLEAKARTFEESAEQHTASARALEKAIEGVDLEAPCDERKLADEYAAASTEVARMRQENANRDRAAEAAKGAQARLAEMGAAADDPAKLELLAANYRHSAQSARHEIDRMREDIARMEAEAVALDDRAEGINSRAIVARRQAELRDRLSAEAAAAVPEGYGDEAIAEGDAKVAEATTAMEAGAAIRLARLQAESAKSKGAMAKANTKAGQAFRRRAVAVDDALTNLLPSDCPLRVEAGRLVIETDRSKSEPYAELSDGNRWIVAINFAAKQLPEGGLLTLSQSAWGEISPANRALIGAEAERLGISILTAEAADCPLTAEHLLTAAVAVGSHEEESE